MSDQYYYEYEVGGQYFYPGTHVLCNKLGIQDAVVFREAEREITSLNLAEIKEHPVKGKYDFAHLKAIHKKLFGDIYTWAGKIRTVNIAKGNLFCNVDYIATFADKLFSELKAEDYLLHCPTDKICARLAYYLGEINTMHPFREGNGRTQRAFIESLALAAGYYLDFSVVTPEQMIEASARSFELDYAPMEALLKSGLSKASKEEQLAHLQAVCGPRSQICLIVFKQEKGI